jgi:S1-C subfamily serine protease
MMVRFVLAWMLLSGLLIAGCGGGSNSQSEIDVDPTVETTVSENLETLTQALKENSDLKALRFNLAQELNSPKFSAPKLFVSGENLKALREAKNAFLSEIKNPYTEFLKNEINSLLSERKRLENLGLPYGYDFPESGFPIERKEAVLALAEGLRSSIVTVQSGGGMGTGFVIGNDLIVTNEHVISGEGTGYRSGVISGIIVKTFGGENFNAEMLGYDKVWDVALLRTDAPLGVPVLTLGDSKKLQYGNPLFAIGHPGQMGNWALTAGVLVQSETIVNIPSRKNYDADIEFEVALAAQQKLLEPQATKYKEGDPGTKTIVQTTVPGMIGSSGSPIFNVNGEVIALLWGATGIEIGTDMDPNSGIGSFKDPMPHIMHSVPVRVSREWTVGSPAWKVEELIAKWLDVEP